VRLTISTDKKNDDRIKKAFGLALDLDGPATVADIKAALADRIHRVVDAVEKKAARRKAKNKKRVDL